MFFCKTKENIIMKKKYCLIELFSLFCVVLFPQARGQTYYNFALGGDMSFSPTHSIIRPIDAQRAVAYYDAITGGAAPSMALLDLSTIMSSTQGLKLRPD